MAKFMVKALVITALVCLAVDLAQSEKAQGNDDLGFNAAKDKVVDYVKSVKEKTSETLDKVLQTTFNGSDYTRNFENKVTDFIGEAMSKIKNTIGNSEKPDAPKS